MGTIVLSLTPGVAASQAAQASVGAGVGTVRHEGGTSFSSAALSPALRFESPGFASGLDGTIASLPGGTWSTQGRADLWLATPPLGAWRVALQLTGAGTAHTDGGWSAAAHGLAEILWLGPGWGAALGAGPSGGWIAQEPSVTAFRARARLWGRRGAAAYNLSVEPTRFLDAWFTDASAVVTVTAGQVSATLWGTARVSAAFGSSGGGGAFAQVFLGPRVALELGGGRHIREPYEGLPQAAYGSVGIRLYAAPRARPAAPPTVWPPLTLERRGDSVTVRFRMEGAAAVAIAGAWNGWQPHPLHTSGDAIWVGTLVIPPGTHQFNLVVNGTEWVVPAGVAVIKDDLGGMAGLLLVR